MVECLELWRLSDMQCTVMSSYPGQVELMVRSTSVLSHTYTRGDKVSMLTHTYPHKPLGKIKVTIYNHQADSPFYVWPDIWSGELQV